MILFLYGADTFRSLQKLKEIVSHYEKIYPGGLSLKYPEPEEESYQEFKKEFYQKGLFKEKKLIVLKNIFSNQEFKKEFLKSIEDIAKSPDIILILEKKDVSEKDKFFQVLKKYSKIQKFDFLKGEELEKWAEKKFQGLGISLAKKGEELSDGVKIEIQAFKKLLEFTGKDIWRLNNEIEKLANYRTKGVISEKDVELLTEQKIETDIFKTIEYLAKKEKAIALDLIQKHLEKGDNPFYLLSMINFQFRTLLLLKSAEIVLKYNFSPWALSQSLGMHPYVIKKTMFLTKKFSLPELKKIYQKFFKTDLNIKIGKISPIDGLKMLIAEI